MRAMRPFRRSRLIVTILLVLAGIVVLVGAWLGWQAWQVNKDLSAAVDDAHRLESALEDGNSAEIDSSLAALRDHSGSAANRTDGVGWSLLTHLPSLGDDARGVRLVSDVVSALSEDGLQPLADTATNLDSILPKNGRVPVDAVRSLQDPVARASQALDEADRRLAAGDPSGFIQRFGATYRDLAAKVSDAARSLRAADTALAVIPSILGADGPRSYLMVFQNNAEIRATGGLPGAVSLVTANDGKIEMTRQVAGNSFGRRATPVLPLTETERKLYGHQLGTYFLDANFTPDFPRTADLMRARWEEIYGGRLSGVLSIDPVALSYLLEATGPVDVGDVTLTADNAVAELLHDVYLRYSSPAEQDAFFRSVARALFDRISSGAGTAPRKLITALSRGADEGRVYIHSFDSGEQEALGGTRVAGEFVTDVTSRPEVNVTLNDTTGAKMSYYLRFSVGATATSCLGTSQSVAVHARLTSNAPDDAEELPAYITGAGVYGVKPGNQIVTIRLFAPVDGEIKQFMINSEAFPVDGVSVDGRAVATAFVTLSPGETVDVDWSLQTGPGQTANANLVVTPGIENSGSAFVRSACS